LKIKRLDHHGIVSGVIDDLGIVDLIDEQINQDEQQEITTGEAVKGMIMNGLGFSNRPLSLSPQFFTNLPMEHLFRPGVEAGHFNRHKLGRSLDQCDEYGSSQLFSLIAEKACRQDNVDSSFQSLDTTSYSLSGDYETTMEQEDSTAINITHGYSKDKRADLKQVVQEVIVSQDGGVPLACKAWDGNASDNKIFKERTKALINSFKSSEMPKYLVADSKLYPIKIS
jgi:transposase